MYHMKQASIRDLRYNFPRIRRLLRLGESVEITERGQVIGHLQPARPGNGAWPDFEARWKAQFGDRVLLPTGAELISEERDRY